MRSGAGFHGLQAAFYRDGPGIQVLARLVDHSGFGGVVMGDPNAA